MQRIKIDFDNPGLPKRLEVMENDAQSRFFEAELYQGGKAYSAPSGATYSIMYHGFGPQNEGWYDTINDGAGKRAACTVSGNVVTCEIARQALRVPGHMTVILCVTASNGYMLKGWPITANVRNDDYDDGEEVEMYFNLSGNVSNAIDQLKKAIAEAEQAKKDIETKAAEALASIPEDYTELNTNVKQIKEDLGNIFRTDNLKSNKDYTNTRIRDTDGKFVVNTTGLTKTFKIEKGKKYIIECKNNDAFRIAYNDSLNSGENNVTGMILIYANDTRNAFSFVNQHENGYLYICYSLSNSGDGTVTVKSVNTKLEVEPENTTFMKFVKLNTDNLLNFSDIVIKSSTKPETGEQAQDTSPCTVTIKNNRIEMSTKVEEIGTSARYILLKKIEKLEAGTYTLSIQNHTFVELSNLDVIVSKGLPLNSNTNRIAKISCNYNIRSVSFTLDSDTENIYLFLLMYKDFSLPYCSFYLQLEKGESYTQYVNPNDGNYWVDEKSYNVAMHSQQEIAKMYMSDNSKDNMAWTYGWTNPYVIRANRKIFLGYIRKNYFLNKYYAGVTCIDNTGNTANIDLVESNICDDHNAAAVILTPKNKILVGCSTGHGYDNKVHIVRFRESFQILGGYDMITIELDSIKYPEAKTSYSQFIKTSNDRLIIIFRVQMPEQNTIWAMSYSDDDGITWSEALPFCNMNKYMMVRQRNDDKCALIVGSHPTHEPHNQVLIGYVDFVTGKAYGKDGKTVRSDNIYDGGFELIEKDGVDTIINGIAVRRRLIDYYPSDIGKECILFANATDETNNDFVYYLYNGNETKELVHSGKAFYTPSSYIGGGCIVDQNTVIVSRNNNDGTWDIVKCIISNDNVSEEIIAHDDVMLLRPLHIHGMVIYQSGEYIDGTFNNWSLDAQIESIN